MWGRLLAVLPALLLSAGCSIYPVSYALVNTERLENRPGVRLMDPNDVGYPIQIAQLGGRTGTGSETAGRVEQASRCRVKYHGLYNTAGFMVVEGKIGENKYPVVLDTGATQAVFVKDIHVLDNNLAICPAGTYDTGLADYGLGFCYVPQLQIGQTQLLDLAGFYLERRMELQVFGVSIAKDDSIILGVPALRQFKYVMFDSVKKEVEFSGDEQFEPSQTERWEQWPFLIEEDFHGNAVLLVEIEIAGEKVQLQLDTGSGDGLAIGEELWEKIRTRIPNVRLKKGVELYPYIGQLPCRQGTIRGLKFGDRAVKKASISIFPDDSPLISDCAGMLGMQYFRETVMVLDFERELMWVKGSRG